MAAAAKSNVRTNKAVNYSKNTNATTDYNRTHELVEKNVESDLIEQALVAPPDELPPADLAAPGGLLQTKMSDLLKTAAGIASRARNAMTQRSTPSVESSPVRTSDLMRMSGRIVTAARDRLAAAMDSQTADSTAAEEFKEKLHKLFVNLEWHLAGLYKEPASIRRVLDDAGVDTRLVYVEQAPINAWYAGLSLAAKSGRFENLLATVDAEYPSPEFTSYIDCYNALLSNSASNQMSIISTLPMAPTTTLTAVIPGDYTAFVADKDLDRLKRLIAADLDIDASGIDISVAPGSIRLLIELPQANIVELHNKLPKILKDEYGYSTSHIDLSETDLRGADLRGVDLSDFDLSNTKLDKARYNKDTAFPVGFDPDVSQMILKED